jgi:hypothetical protein
MGSMNCPFRLAANSRILLGSSQLTGSLVLLALALGATPVACLLTVGWAGLRLRAVLLRPRGETPKPS